MMTGTNFFGEDPLAAADRLERLAADLRRLARSDPSDDDMEGAPIIRTADIVVRSCFALSGEVIGHPHLRDGRICLTSELYALAEDKSWARTGSRFYRLVPPLQSRKSHAEQ